MFQEIVCRVCGLNYLQKKTTIKHGTIVKFYCHRKNTNAHERIDVQRKKIHNDNDDWLRRTVHHNQNTLLDVIVQLHQIRIEHLVDNFFALRNEQNIILYVSRRITSNVSGNYFSQKRNGLR